MWSRRKSITICLDSIIVDFKLENVYKTPIKIQIDHNITTSSYFIEKIENKKGIPLKIEKEVIISDNMPNETITIYVYLEDIAVIKEKIDISKNIIGALKTDKNIFVSLVFRIINRFTNDIRIFKIHQFYIDEFLINREINKGRYGRAFKVTDSESRKHVFKKFEEKINIKDPKNVIIREIIPFIALPSHPCMIKLEGFINNSDDNFILVLEYADRGRISEVDIKKLNDDKICRILYGLCSCIAFIHDYGYIYRDIHPSNVLITKEYDVKLIDFGISRFINEDMTKDLGHMGYIAPEAINYKNYNELVDEYQLGVLLNEIGLKSGWVSELLLHDDPASRITCSETCTLLESWSNSKTNSLYYSELSNYHSSMPLRDEIIMQGALLNRMKDGDLYFDLFKLAANIGITGAKIYFDQLTRRYEGIAFDCECIPNLDLSRFCKGDDYEGFKNIIKEKYYGKEYLRISNSTEYKMFSLKNLHNMNKKELQNYFCHLLMANSRMKMDPRYVVTFHKKYSELSNRPDFFTSLLKAAKNYHNYLGSYSFDVLQCAASLDSVDACEFLAHLYSRNWPSGIDYVKYYAEKAFKSGRKASGVYLGMIAKTLGRENEALEYFRASANYDPISKYMMAMYYFNECNDNQKGLEYLKSSANEGCQFAQDQLAEFNLLGRYIPKNPSQAYWYNSLSVNQGNYRSLFVQGLFFFFGINMPVDYEKARHYFEECNRKGNNRDAYHLLSAIYFLGLGVDVDFKKANHYLQLYKGDPMESEYYAQIMEYIPHMDSYLFKGKENKKIISRKDHIAEVMPKLKRHILDQVSLSELYS